jgi:hypothetical protein
MWESSEGQMTRKDLSGPIFLFWTIIPICVAHA